MNMRWRVGDVVHAIQIPRDDLNQAISRDGFCPEHTPDPGKERWYGWRDVVAIAVAQELRNIGLGPSIAFRYVQEHLSQYLRANVDQPSGCIGVVWLIYGFEGRFKKESRCEFVQLANIRDILISPNESACIVVNIGQIAKRTLDELHAPEGA